MDKEASSSPVTVSFLVNSPKLVNGGGSKSVYEGRTLWNGLAPANQNDTWWVGSYDFLPQASSAKFKSWSLSWISL